MTQRAALVTGVSSGIGRAVARALLDRGWRVLGVALEVPDFTHPALTALTADLSDPAAVAARAATVAASGATALVHSAGVVRAAMLPEVKAQDMAMLCQLHLATPVALAQAMLPAMRAGHWGRIVLIGSRAALGLATRTAYSATKAGMVGLTRTWALELAADGITANVIAPGPIAGTRVFHEVIEAGSERERRLARAIPVGRLGRPEDVAHAALFFLDEAASFVTGQTLYVCGGTSVGSVTI